MARPRRGPRALPSARAARAAAGGGEPGLTVGRVARVAARAAAARAKAAAAAGVPPDVLGQSLDGWAQGAAPAARPLAPPRRLRLAARARALGRGRVIRLRLPRRRAGGADAGELLRQARAVRDAAADSGGLAATAGLLLCALRRGRPAAAAKRAADRLALALLQRAAGVPDAAAGEAAGKLLVAAAGHRVRLSQGVLLGRGEPQPTHPDQPAVWDGAVPAALLGHLQREFCPPGALYWREHRYSADGSPYFSYLVPLLGAESSIAQLGALCFEHVRSVLPGAAQRAVRCEWWAHCRPGSRGHPLHYDTDDEGRCGVSSPAATAIVYLTGCGGPTLVCAQRRGAAALAERGWLVEPAPGRVAVYSGDLFHGVVPGRLPDPGLRVTLMFAFWAEGACRPRHSPEPCAARPFPTAASGWRCGGGPAYRWPRGLLRRADWGTTAPRPAAPLHVAPVWRPTAPRHAAVLTGPVPTFDDCYMGF